jgi:hypothetical protein
MTIEQELENLQISQADFEALLERYCEMLNAQIIVERLASYREQP